MEGEREGEGGKRVMEEVEEEVEEQHAATSSSKWVESRRRRGSIPSPSSPSSSSSSSSSATKGFMDEGGEADGGEGMHTPHQHLKASGDLLRAFPSMTEQTPPPSPRLQGDDDKRNQQGGNNFTINLGRALDHLRVDVPLLFDREPDLSIYTEDVRLRDEARVYASGKFMYQMVYFSLRLAKVFMPMPPLVEVLNIRWCPARQCIEVRFQIRVDTLSDSLYFDAVSVYRVNAKGLIYEHLIEKSTCASPLPSLPSLLPPPGVSMTPDSPSQSFFPHPLPSFTILPSLPSPLFRPICCHVPNHKESTLTANPPSPLSSFSHPQRPLGETLYGQPLLRHAPGAHWGEPAHS